MQHKGLLFVVYLVILLSITVKGQRAYSPHSVLASGNWYKIALKQEGIYKVDVNFLNSLGINTSGLSSGSIRLFGNGGAILAEYNAIPRIDDLYENAIEVVDGGDGLFNGNDYFLFYAPGPDNWEKDSLNRSFRHHKNLYADSAYYFLTIGGNGKRIATQPVQASPAITINSFDERYFHENQLVNLLHSGKEWYGEAFTNVTGGISSRSFSVDWPGLLTSQPLRLATDLAARSVGAGGSFSVMLNGAVAQTVSIPSVTGYFLDPYASNSVQSAGVAGASRSKIDIGFAWSSPAAGAQGWLNWFELFGRRSLSVEANKTLFFRDWSSVSAQTGRFQISNAVAGMNVWEITNPLEPRKMRTAIVGPQLVFDNDLSRLREYTAFSATGLLAPVAVGKIVNQDLHNSVTTDLLIITHTALLAEAQRLAKFHEQHDGYTVTVVTTEQVANEFGCGVADPSAIRDFAKMYYDKGGNANGRKPSWLLLFGSGSYQYTGGGLQRSLVPAWETVNSLDPLNTYTTDDFFGLLNDGDDINRNDPSMQLAIGVGRIPARSIDEAKTMVDKIIHYHDKQSLGAWRNQLSFVADDGDSNLHLEDAETIAASAKQANALYNQSKIYLDAYPLVSGSGGTRYPAVNDAIVNQVFNGTLIMNYSGHGSYQRLADESVLTQEELNRFNNPDKLPLLITASCDFAPHDDPSLNSLGTGILMGSHNGAIALLTTTRVVFAYSNRQINDNYLKTALRQDVNGRYLTLGESLQQAKNMTMQATGDVINNRKFTLLGDPAMRLGFPEWRLQLATVNDRPIAGNDTLRALQRYSFSGMVTDASGLPVPVFNGKLTVTVFDKPQELRTRGNDPSSIVTSFLQQTAILYKGEVTVKDGKFVFSFIMPKDISFQPGKGRISLYGDDSIHTASGVDTSFWVGGQGIQAVPDTKGPDIRPFINDDKFIDGGLTHETPVLLLKLYDSSGISTSGNAIGHDITAVIDGNERNVLVLNAYYTADRDSYRSGVVRFQLPVLEEGEHTIRIKAWDVANNSSEVTIRFVVSRQEKLQIRNVRNFPNPFTVNTVFGFEHNQPGTDMDVTIDIFSGSGAFVKQIHQVVNTGGSRNCQINWAGDNQAGAKLPKAVYIYRVIVVAGGQRSTSSGQLIVQ